MSTINRPLSQETPLSINEEQISTEIESPHRLTLRQPNFLAETLSNMGIRITTADLERARLAKAIIEKDLTRHYSYHDLAHLVGTNVTKLQAIFKDVTGKNLYEYLTIIRVERAIKLLEETELTIDAVAYKVGLDRTNLNKQFKKLKGKSPSEWRLEGENNNLKRFSKTG